MPRLPLPRGGARPPTLLRPAPFAPDPAASVLPILTYPSPALRARCAPFPPPPPPSAAAALLRDLRATLHARRGLGLAAPQVGALLRAFVVRTPLGWTAAEAARARAGEAPPPRAQSPFFTTCVNPRIVERSEDKALGVESCLSLEGEALLVRRAAKITAEWEEGGAGQAAATVRAVMDGLPAVVFQHELDHLDGVLIVDREVKVAEREEDAAFGQAEEHFRRALRRFYTT